MLPVVTLAIEFAFLIGGLVVTEQVFNLNALNGCSCSQSRTRINVDPEFLGSATY